MILLCGTWALQQVAVKAVANEISPILQLAIRSGAATFLVGALMWGRGERISFLNGNWRPGILIGLLFAMEFLLVGQGLRFTSASHMVVFLYTAPIFAALGLHWRLPEERLKGLQWAGIGIAFLGIVIAFQGRETQVAGSSGKALFGDLFGLLAGASWGATTFVIRCSRLSKASASETLIYQLMVACLLLSLAAGALGETVFHPSGLAWASLFFQTFIVSFASFLVWFWMLRKYLASRLGVLSFMTPVFGILFGVWLLHEPLETKFLTGAVLVMAGILLVTGYGWLEAALARPRT